MADVQISVSDSLGIIFGRWLKLITSNGSSLSVENDLYLKENDGSNSFIPVTNDTIKLGISEVIPLHSGELISITAGLFRTDTLDLLIQDTSSMKVFISTDDTLDIIVVDDSSGDRPFILYNKDIWSFKKVADQWILKDSVTTWQDIEAKFDWVFANDKTDWNFSTDKTDWTLEKDKTDWINKNYPHIWVLRKK